MDVPILVEHLRQQGVLLCTAAAAVPVETPVPTCPGWSVRDLVQHVGGVHRWAAAYVRDGLLEAQPERDLERVVGGWPSDDALIDWFDAGHRAVVDALAAAPADLDCWTFLAAPSPLAHWARRQAHETTIHRLDAEAAAGRSTPVPSDLAADGIDELLTCFVTRPGRGLQTDRPQAIRVRTTDTDDTWLVQTSQDRLTTTRGPDGHADVEISGPAAELYAGLWNRRPLEDLTVHGDGSLLAAWREQVHVRWT